MASSPCWEAGWGGSEWVWSASSSLHPGHLLFCLPGPLPRAHDTPCCYQLPGQSRDMDPTGWTPCPSSTTPRSSSGSALCWPAHLACCLASFAPPVRSCSVQSGALALLLAWGWGLSSVLHLSTQRQGEKEGGTILGPWAGFLGLSQILRWPCFGIWGLCCLPCHGCRHQMLLLTLGGTRDYSQSSTQPTRLVDCPNSCSSGLGLEPWRAAPCQSLPRLEPQLRASLGLQCTC